MVLLAREFKMADAVAPFVSFNNITYFRSFVACFVIAVGYVASLYINKSPLPRDHPKTIYQRFKSVAVVSLSAPVYVWLWSDNRLQTNQEHAVYSLWRWLGIHVSNTLTAAALPLFLTIILFLGPLLLLLLNGDVKLKLSGYFKYNSMLLDSVQIRNYIVAPLTEEFVYRACMLPLLVPCFGVTTSIIICPLFFGVAHVHHVIERLCVNNEDPKEVWLSALFQFGYTTVFGAYSAFLFVRTGHLIGPVVCHSFCNFMGFPQVEEVPNSKYPKIIAGSFVVGLVVFLLLALPLTEPSLYGSIYYL
ncbi:CAAX prenyl protease 2-like [Actinia tenebrosa]|uniref:CAAX prenyl protease 2 n=1 Tax=Actinia tenebrosa TaxID=6105 RepID=A0A6P8IU92_ACTTE|nr:CAAX prenyl protease 2-like [Actinia tenebrosa]